MNIIAKNKLHCGACVQKFSSIEKLSAHLQDCPEASCLLPLIHTVSFGGDKIGHPLAHFIYCFAKAVKKNLIKKYAYSVADEINILKRASLHTELCETLEFDYKKFRPFESKFIIETLDRKQAHKYLCREIFVYVHTLT